MVIPTINADSYHSAYGSISCDRLASYRFSPRLKSESDKVGINEVIRRCKAVFFDRDGVLNDAIVKDGKPFPPSSVDELHIEEDAPRELNRLSAEGFILIGVTNQPDVARGTQRREVVESINDVIMKVLPLKEIRVCYHDDANNCNCRKPKPGLLLDASQEYNINLSLSYMVGDRWKHIEAGKQGRVQDDLDKSRI